MLHFGRGIVNHPTFATQREWLVTNGLGGFAAGTISGVLTRRYHGLLVAALRPPLGRTLLVSKLDETARYGEQRYTLYTNSWAPDSLYNRGYEHLDRFALDGTTPVWTYALGDARLEKRLWMQPGANTTYVRYGLTRGRGPVTLQIKALVNYRDYHNVTRANDWQMHIDRVEHGVRVEAYSDATPFYLLSDGAEATPQHIWYRNYYLACEAQRGLEEREDHLLAAEFKAVLQPGATLTLILTSEGDAVDMAGGESAYAEQKAHESALLAAAGPLLATAPAIMQQLVWAADQFIVARPTPEQADGRTVMAGYPWFSDWGRDTMIALPGLTLTTGRPAVARQILTTFARYVDQGMLPNRFPDAGETPEYNTVDATLWYLEALRAYYAATQDEELVRALWPVLEEIMAWHRRGTRYHIRQDRVDGLLYAGEAGVQLTWMDAKVGDWVVTPRIGKPVEINALWYNALCIMRDLAAVSGSQAQATYAALARQVQTSFARYWNPQTQACYDVLDGPQGHEAALRPNQVLAVALPYSPLTPGQQKGVVEACLSHLLTPMGLRSLAPFEKEYLGQYGGPLRERDGAYHQGVVWAWLIGPFAAAHRRVFNNPHLTRSFLEPLLDHVADACVGSVSEIFNGDAPFAPQGAFAQAWSVAELLRAWQLTGV